MTAPVPLFDRLSWREPGGLAGLEPLIAARTPAGVPVVGALRVAGTDRGYPIVDCVARLTPELARRYERWLKPFDLRPPDPPGNSAEAFQDLKTVESFGFQWTWNSAMRSESDLRWRVAERFRMAPSEFRGKLVLDAGAGAGDQSAWILRQGASVVSVDLSPAIEVVARKLRLEPGWVGLQGDIGCLPFSSDQFDIVYCEGVIPFTRDSLQTVVELSRVLKPGGVVLATHYGRSFRFLGKLRQAYQSALRRRLSHWERYRLLFMTGSLAALASIPLLGRLLRMSGTTLHDDRMPDFKTTWTNTFDYYGNHSYQRYITADEFWSYFERAGGFEELYREGTTVAARKTRSMLGTR
jgi:ubiquinone/menaquinone biosynthesis C-methylase UbiE